LFSAAGTTRTPAKREARPEALVLAVMKEGKGAQETPAGTRVQGIQVEAGKRVQGIQVEAGKRVQGIQVEAAARAAAARAMADRAADRVMADLSSMERSCGTFRSVRRT